METSSKVHYFFKVNSNLFKNWQEILTLTKRLSKPEDFAQLSAFSFDELDLTLLYLFNSVDDDADTDLNLLQAKEQLLKLLYRGYSVLLALLIEEIYKITNRYKKETITTVCSQYYQEIHPRVMLIQETVSDLTSEKNIDIISEKYDISILWGEAQFLIKSRKQLAGFNNEFEDFEKEKTADKNKERKFQILMGIALAILGAILGALIAS